MPTLCPICLREFKGSRVDPSLVLWESEVYTNPEATKERLASFLAP